MPTSRDKISNKQLYTPKEVEREEQTKHKVNWRKEIKIRVEINEIETKRQ